MKTPTDGGTGGRLDRRSSAYGGRRRSPGLSLDVSRGEMFGLIGPDGAGKTTAIPSDVRAAASGCGRAARARSRSGARASALTERVGYLSQRFSLYGDLTIDENIAFFAEVHGVRDYRRDATVAAR